MNILLGAQASSFPSSSFATPDRRNEHPVVDFDDASDEAVTFHAVARNYDGSSSISVDIHYAMTSATSGDVVLGVSFERIGEGQQDIDSDGYATEQTVTDTVPGTSGNVGKATVTLTQAEADSLGADELFRLRVRRLGTNGSDTATGDVELVYVEVRS